MRTSFYDILINDFDKLMARPTGRTFPINVFEGEGYYKVYAEMPGVNKKDINVDFEDGMLTIYANVNKDENTYLLREIPNHPFKRQINFGNIKEDNIKAKYNDGVLEIIITLKREQEKTKKAIRIE